MTLALASFFLIQGSSYGGQKSIVSNKQDTIVSILSSNMQSEDLQGDTFSPSLEIDTTKNFLGLMFQDTGDKQSLEERARDIGVNVSIEWIDRQSYNALDTKQGTILLPKNYTQINKDSLDTFAHQGHIYHGYDTNGLIYKEKFGGNRGYNDTIGFFDLRTHDVLSSYDAKRYVQMPPIKKIYIPTDVRPGELPHIARDIVSQIGLLDSFNDPLLQGEAYALQLFVFLYTYNQIHQSDDHQSFLASYQNRLSKEFGTNTTSPFADIFNDISTHNVIVSHVQERLQVFWKNGNVLDQQIENHYQIFEQNIGSSDMSVQALQKMLIVYFEKIFIRSLYLHGQSSIVQYLTKITYYENTSSTSSYENTIIQDVASLLGGHITKDRRNGKDQKTIERIEYKIIETLQSHILRFPKFHRNKYQLDELFFDNTTQCLMHSVIMSSFCKKVGIVHTGIDFPGHMGLMIYIGDHKYYVDVLSNKISGPFAKTSKDWHTHTMYYTLSDNPSLMFQEGGVDNYVISNIYNNKSIIAMPQDSLLSINQQSINELTKAIAFNNNNGTAYYNRGIEYHDLGNDDMAIDDFTKAISYGAHLENAYAYRGYLYTITNEYEKALDDFFALIALKNQQKKGQKKKDIVHLSKKNYILDDHDTSEYDIEFYHSLMKIYYTIHKNDQNNKNDQNSIRISKEKIQILQKIIKEIDYQTMYKNMQ